MKSVIETLNQIIEEGTRRKLVHNFTSSNSTIPDSHIVIDNHKMLNFGSCSYLGLEKHSNLQHGVINAVSKYGTQFSSSRTYLSHSLYQELEDNLYQIFNRPVIATASTTLGHLATIPVVVGKNDAVILDLQVHSSIQMTVQQLKAKKIPVHIINHNCTESLEYKIKSLYNKHDKIWYFADGVYSMYGDYAPFAALDILLDRYDKFHLYIDDAHGMGWTGENGSGVVCKNLNNKEKVILIVSLNKSFASAGGCVVFPNTETEKLVRNCGSTYLFSGPIQPPMLGAAVASAKLHLSRDILSIQSKLQELILFTNNKLDELNLPQFQKTDSPLFFIPVGLPKICYDIIAKMKDKGFFLNTASFPAVPMRKSGVRFMINNFLNKEQINEMLDILSAVYAETIVKNDTSYDKISKTFGIPHFELNKNNCQDKEELHDNLTYNIYNSIKDLDERQWNEKFKDNGTLSHANLELLENIFANNNSPENNWKFYYLRVKDNDQIVLLTFITVALTKDDMFSQPHISKKIEKERTKNNPHYLTSKTVLTGSLITKGNHVYINYNNSNWKKALSILTENLTKIQDSNEDTKIMIRDFYDSHHIDLETIMLEKGFIKFQLPNNMVINNLQWNDVDEYLSSLSHKNRYSVKKEILKHQSNFILDYTKPNNEQDLQEIYKLYENVYDKSFMFNVFKLPFAYFKEMWASKHYDIIKLYLKTSQNESSLAGVMFSHVDSNNYNALIVGLNYEHVYEYNCYKQILFQTVLRAKYLGCKKLDLAFTAELEKKKIGAQTVNVFAYVQSSEHLNESIIEFT